MYETPNAQQSELVHQNIVGRVEQSETHWRQFKKTSMFL
jgi:hypothetical protein